MIFAFYGSLRVGGYNWRWSLANNPAVKHLGTEIAKGYVMYSLGAFPAIVAASQEDEIIVDVFDIQDQRVIYRISAMEYGAGYALEHITVGQHEHVGIFVYPRKPTFARGTVTGGDWCKYLTAITAPA